VFRWDLDVSDNTPSHEAVFQCDKLRVLFRVDDFDVEKLDVEVLIDAVEGTGHYDIVLEFDRDFLPDQSFEKRNKYHDNRICSNSKSISGEYFIEFPPMNRFRCDQKVVSGSQDDPIVCVVGLMLLS